MGEADIEGSQDYEEHMKASVIYILTQLQDGEMPQTAGSPQKGHSTVLSLDCI